MEEKEYTLEEILKILSDDPAGPAKENSSPASNDIKEPEVFENNSESKASNDDKEPEELEAYALHKNADGKLVDRFGNLIEDRPVSDEED